MKSYRALVIGIGLFLVGLGIYALVYQDNRIEEKKIELGPVQATIQTGPACSKLPVVFGALVIIAGGSLILLHFARRQP